MGYSFELQETFRTLHRYHSYVERWKIYFYTKYNTHSFMKAIRYGVGLFSRYSNYHGKLKEDTINGSHYP